MKSISDEIDKYFRLDGFNCSETTFKILFDNGYIKDADEKNIKMLTGFGGGLTKGYLCGSVVAAVIAIGSFYGRTKPEQSRVPSKKIVNQYLEDFLKKYGSLNCKDLIKEYEPKTHEQYEHCKKIIASSINSCINVLKDKAGS